jgi:hypothetical protein
MREGWRSLHPSISVWRKPHVKPRRASEKIKKTRIFFT